MLTALVVAAVVRMIWVLPRTRWSTEVVHQARTDVPATPVSEPRCVVLISIDTCRADHLGCYGYSRKTSPNIDALAAEGILFNHAVSPVPLTLPSHCSMLTGTTPLYHRVHDNYNYRLSDSNVTLAEVLRDKGFKTGAVVSSFVLDSQFGLNQGFDYYDDFGTRKKINNLRLSNERGAEQVTQLANKWLESQKGNKFFLFLHYFDPHAPYESHKDFPFSSFYIVSLPRDRYDSEIAYADYCVGQVVRKLKELGLYDSTLLIITSDHGEGLGEHSESTHSYFIYHTTQHVPLIMRIPGGPKGVKIQETVGLIDIVPTVCAAMDITEVPYVEGQDLNALIFNNGNSYQSRPVFSETLYPTKFEFSAFLGLTSGPWKYIHSPNPELYNLINDPSETKNILGQETQKLRELQNKLKMNLQNSKGNPADTQDSKTYVSEETMNRLQSLGYLAGQTVDDQIQFEQAGPDPKDYIELSNFMASFPIMLSAGKIDKAKKLCHNLLRKWPHISQLYYSLGQAAGCENDHDSVITYFSMYLEKVNEKTKAQNLKIEPRYEYADAHIKLAKAFELKGRSQQAIEHYIKSQKIYSSLGMQKKADEIEEHLRWYKVTLIRDGDLKVFE